VITLEGTALSPGVASGPAMKMPPPVQGEAVRIADNRTPTQQFHDARRAAEAELRTAIEVLPALAGPAREILRAHLALVADPSLIAEVESRFTGDGVDAQQALRRAADALSGRFEAMADGTMRQRAADLRDVFECIARHLTEDAATDATPAEPRVVCATDLSPAQVLRLGRMRPLAFVLERGAETSHAAILMRALAVPTVIGVPGATTFVHDGDVVLVDGDRGRVLVHPDPDLPVAPHIKSSTTYESDPEPAVTRDGVAIAVTATIADAADARRAIAAGADGIGLLRTEVLFLGGDELPSEAMQAAFHREIGAAIGLRPLTVRILDLGADKQSPAVRLDRGPNPALGLRGVRLLLARPRLLMSQLRALLYAIGERRVRLLVPMVIDAAELSEVRKLLEKAARDVGAGVPNVAVGAMVETPAAALMAEEVAAAADFLSIGTNDLAQYVLAADRDSAAMARYYQPLHPAVLRLVRDVIATATRQGKPVSVCGETAADPLAIPLFIGMGVTELSVPPAAVARVKVQVRQCTRDA